ncbi:hypothetical protein ABPG74_022810 [Tetrahymena malaccensis]
MNQKNQIYEQIVYIDFIINQQRLDEIINHKQYLLKQINPCFFFIYQKIYQIRVQINQKQLSGKRQKYSNKQIKDNQQQVINQLINLICQNQTKPRLQDKVNIQLTIYITICIYIKIFIFIDQHFFTFLSNKRRYLLTILNISNNINNLEFFSNHDQKHFYHYVILKEAINFDFRERIIF